MDPTPAPQKMCVGGDCDGWWPGLTRVCSFKARVILGRDKLDETRTGVVTRLSVDWEPDASTTESPSRVRHKRSTHTRSWISGSQSRTALDKIVQKSVWHPRVTVAGLVKGYEGKGKAGAS